MDNYIVHTNYVSRKQTNFSFGGGGWAGLIKALKYLLKPNRLATPTIHISNISSNFISAVKAM
jgi:hypothetical protein